MKENIITPVAYIKNDFKEKFGVPRQSGRAPSNLSYIIFNEEFRSEQAIRGLENFNYIWLIFDFSLTHRKNISLTVRPPRLGGNTRRGVFATRSPFRPNSIGLSSVRLIEIKNTEKYGHVLVVSGADLVNNTPVYDIKPYIPSSDCHTDANGSFSDDYKNYHLNVIFPETLSSLIPVEKIKGLTECLADDPRPSYQLDENRVYGMNFSDFNIKFKVKGDTLTVIDIEKI